MGNFFLRNKKCRLEAPPMKKLAAILVALLVAPACGGDQAPASQTPQGSTPADTGTAGTPATATETATAGPTATATETAAPKLSLLDLQLDAVRQTALAFNGRDARKLTSLYAADARIAGPGPTGWMEQTGPAAIEDGYRRLFAAFPDMRWAQPRVYLTGKVVIQEWVLTGTQKGPLGSILATNKPAGANGASVYWFNDEGRIQRQHTYFDSSTLAVQLGGAKGKARPVPELPAGETQLIVAATAAQDNRFVDEAMAFYDSVEKREEKTFLAAFARDATRTSFFLPADRKGEPLAREDYRALIKAFPDLKVATSNLWGFGERVVAEVTTTGTMAGAYQGLKPTKKLATMHTLDVLRFDADGKLVELMSYGSLAELSAAADTAPPAPPR
jgi:predicted ester cyclase